MAADDLVTPGLGVYTDMKMTYDFVKKKILAAHEQLIISTGTYTVVYDSLQLLCSSSVHRYQLCIKLSPASRLLCYLFSPCVSVA